MIVLGGGAVSGDFSSLFWLLCIFRKWTCCFYSKDIKNEKEFEFGSGSLCSRDLPRSLRGKVQLTSRESEKVLGLGLEPEFRTRAVWPWANHSTPLGFSGVPWQMGPGSLLYSSKNSTRTWLSKDFRNSDRMNAMASLLTAPGKASSAFRHLGKMSVSLLGSPWEYFWPLRYRCSWLILESKTGVISRNASVCGGGAGLGAWNSGFWSQLCPHCCVTLGKSLSLRGLSFPYATGSGHRGH